jgi:6-pyruvoyltetrahydropterin/6-carboxytetrahydropterin synthase
MANESPEGIVEIDLSKERMKFSAGHFTIFSATERENLHGHNFTVAVTFKAQILDNGMVCDYGILKKVAQKVCDSLDELFLLPQHSKYLRIEQRDGIVIVKFANETLQFLQRDVKILPIVNVTVEDLSGWFLQSLREGLSAEIAPLMREISVRVDSGPGQGATTRWAAPKAK